AERNLVKTLIQNLCSVINVPIEEIEINKMMQRHAPAGEKRRFIVLTGHAEETINTDGLPPFSTVQPFDEQTLEDEIGIHVRDSLKHDYGSISAEQKNIVCNAVVEFLFDRLQCAVSQLSRKNLFPELVGRHESLIAQRRTLEVMMATHFACFGKTEKNIA